jgi:hypothetical protein
MSPRTQENSKKPKPPSSPPLKTKKPAVKKPAPKNAAAAAVPAKEAKQIKQYPKDSAIVKAHRAGKAVFHATIDMVTGQPLRAPDDWHLPAWYVLQIHSCCA